ncbi:MAG: immune inhibitor A, partial [bacterium]
LAKEIILDDIDGYAESLLQQDYLDNFRTYDQMLTELQTIEAAHPDIAKLYDIGDSWEKDKGHADRDIWALKISDNVEQEEEFECEVLYIALHHAREIITPEILMYFINYLVDNYGIDKKVTFIVNNRQLWLIPMMNPDGHHYVFTTDLWWRKNRRDNGDGTYGVDLNRNWGYAWGYDDLGSSPYTSSETYRGPGPFSELETQAVRDLALAHNFIISISYHSYGQLYLFPWGYIRQSSPDHQTFLEIADSMAAYNGYTPQMGWQLYLVNGDSDDWLYGEQTQKNKIYAFTPEVGTQFHPDTSTIMKEILENLGPNLYVAYVADQYSPKPQIVHTPLKDTEDAIGPYRLISIITPFCIRLDTTNLFVCFNTTGVPPFDSLALTPTGNPDEYSAEIPGLGDNIIIYYYLSAQDEISRFVYSPPKAPDTLYSFAVRPDTIAPEIVHTPLEDQCQYLERFLITAEITDNMGIADVYLLYRQNGGELDTVQMAVDTTSTICQAYIQPTTLDSGDVIEYKIVVKDQATIPNLTTHPDSGFHIFNIIDHIIFTFEQNNGNFCKSDPGWEWGIPYSGPDSAYSGVNVWATNLDGNYDDNSQIYLDSPIINLKNFPYAKLEFYHYYDFESDVGKYWDGGNVKVSEDNGQTWSILTPTSDYPCDNIFALGEVGYGAQSDDWINAEFDLSSYLGKEINIRFHFGSDAETNRAGWYVDDIAIKPELATMVQEEERNRWLPTEYSLSQNYPNPFNPETTIKYQIVKDGWITLRIYNLLGQIVYTLVDEHQKAGKYNINWDGKDNWGKQVTAGIYFYSIKSGSFHKSKKMILLP